MVVGHAEQYGRAPLTRLGNLAARQRPFPALFKLAFAVTVPAFLISAVPGRAETTAEAGTALILAVGVSNSVDDTRFQLQMEGIARALEDKGVADAITGGPRGGIFSSLVTWADYAPMTVPWQPIRSA